MTDSNRTQITFIEESTWGTTPGSPNMQELRLTGESLIKNIQNIVSSEIRSDRQITDLIQVAKEASGDVNLELSYGTYDELMKSALYSEDWSTDAGIVAETDIAADATGFTSSSTDFTTNIEVGQWIQVTNFVDASINGYYRVTSVTANDLNTSPVPGGTEAAGQAITIKGSYIRNGTNETSFSIEKGFLDASEYFLFTGMIAAQMNLNVESQQIVSGGFTFMGKDGALSSSSVDASPTDANSNEVMNAIGNVGSIREGDSEVSSPNYVRSVSLAVNNNLRQQYAVGSDSLIGVGAGKCDVTGVLNTYFGNSDVMDKYLAGTQTSVDFRISDAAGNVYIFDLPQIEFESGNVVAQGQDQDVFAEMNYRAMRDSTYGFTIQVCRFSA